MKGSDLAAHPFLDGLRRDHLDALASIAMWASIPAGKTIFGECERANRFYLLLSGSVDLRATQGDGTCTLIRTVGGGEVLAWPWHVQNYEWPFSATATEKGKGICFFGAMLRAECERNEELGCELAHRAAVMLQRHAAIERVHFRQMRTPALAPLR